MAASTGSPSFLTMFCAFLTSFTSRLNQLVVGVQAAVANHNTVTEAMGFFESKAGHFLWVDYPSG